MKYTYTCATKASDQHKLVVTVYSEDLIVDIVEIPTANPVWFAWRMTDLCRRFPLLKEEEVETC